MDKEKKKSRLMIWWTFVALGVSLVFGFYHLTLSGSQDYYSPLVLNEEATSFVTDETNFYAPVIREVLDGHLWSSDYFIYEYKEAASPFRSNLVPVLMMGGLAKLTGSVENSFILADFIWPVFSFLSLSYFIYALTKKAYLAPAGALLVMNLGHYFSYFPYLPTALNKMIEAWSTGAYSEFIRSYNPQISLSFMMMFVYVLYRIQVTKQKKNDWWWFGLGLGLLFYTYVYYWTFAVAWTLVLILINFLRKKLVIVKKLILGLTVGLVMAIPMLSEFWRFQQSSLSDWFSLSYRSLPPLTIKPFILITGLLLVSRLLIKNKSERLYWQSLFLTGLGLFFSVHWLKLAIDDPVGHWMNRVIYPFSLLLIYRLAIKRVKKNQILLGICLGLLLLVYQGRVHWQYFNNKAEVFQLEPERIEVFNWLNQNTANDSVVLTTSLIDNTYLPVYTHNNVFIPFSILSLAPFKEAEERMFLVYKTAMVPETRIKQMFSLTEDNQQLMLKKRFKFDDCGGHYLYFRRFVANDFYNCSVPEDYLDQMLTSYREMKGNLASYKDKYKMDYWLWGPNEKKWSMVKPEQFKDWRLVWQNDWYQVYKL